MGWDCSNCGSAFMFRVMLTRSTYGAWWVEEGVEGVVCRMLLSSASELLRGTCYSTVGV